MKRRIAEAVVNGTLVLMFVMLAQKAMRIVIYCYGRFANTLGRPGADALIQIVTITLWLKTVFGAYPSLMRGATMEMVAIEGHGLKKRRACFSCAFAWEAGMPEDDSDSLALAGEEDPLSEQAVDLRGSLDDETAERQISH